MNINKMSNKELLQTIKSATIELENREYTRVMKEGLDAVVHEMTKSPNQQRTELIQRAREFVEEHTRYNGRSHAGTGVRMIGGWIAHPEFLIKPEKRIVVVLFKLISGSRVVARGIAKCHPDEVFNVDIGKAIALARALEIDVPGDFLQAVQPTEVVKGMVLLLENTGLLLKITQENPEELMKYESIFDDSNAKYSEVLE